MKEKITYEIDREVLLSLYKVVGHAPDIYLREKYNLEIKDIANIHLFCNNLRLDDDKDD
jgi:hypothetical protein